MRLDLSIIAFLNLRKFVKYYVYLIKLFLFLLNNYVSIPLRLIILFFLLIFTSFHKFFEFFPILLNHGIRLNVIVAYKRPDLFLQKI